MARTYGKILSSLWVSSRKWRALGDDDRARLLYCYLQSCSHANNVGCFVLPTGYVMADLGWPAETIAQTLDTLRTACLIGWDEAENVVRVVDAIEKDPPTNPSHAAAMVKTALSLPDCPEKLNCLIELARDKRASKVDGLKEAIDTLKAVSRQGGGQGAAPYPTLPNPPQPLPNKTVVDGEGGLGETELPLGDEPAESAPPARASKKVTSLDDLKIDDELRSWAEDRSITVDLSIEMEKFANWHRAKGKQLKDYRHGLRNWLLIAQSFADERALDIRPYLRRTAPGNGSGDLTVERYLAMTADQRLRQLTSEQRVAMNRRLTPEQRAQLETGAHP